MLKGILYDAFTKNVFYTNCSADSYEGAMRTFPDWVVGILRLPHEVLSDRVSRKHYKSNRKRVEANFHVWRNVSG